MRRPKTDRVEKTRADGEWTEAAFWNFITSHLRQMSRRWPPRKNTLLLARVPYVGPNKRQRWAYPCAICGALYKGTEVAVDHIVPCGRMRSYDDLPRFVARLLVDSSGMRVLCKSCHAIETAKQRRGREAAASRD